MSGCFFLKHSVVMFYSMLGTIAYWPWASYLHLCACVTKQYDLVPANRGDLFGCESNRGPGGKYQQPTTGFITCRLTAKKPGSAPCPTLVIEYGTTLLTYLVYQGHVCVCVLDTNDDSILISSQTSYHAISASSHSRYPAPPADHPPATTTSHAHRSVPVDSSSTAVDSSSWYDEFTETGIISLAAAADCNSSTRHCNTGVHFSAQVISRVGSRGTAVGQSETTYHSKTDADFQTEWLQHSRRRYSTD